MASSSVRPARVAELIADNLRDDILSGTIQGQLPKEDELRARFDVGKASMREALVILESESLITVRRGKVGGSDIHLPTTASAAYTLGLVLTAEHIEIGEVGDALLVLEPQCAELCALRPDHADVAAELDALNATMAAKLDDGIAAVAESRVFHEAVVDLCGNRPLGLITGALARVWSAHEYRWASEATEGGKFPGMHDRERALDFHREIATLIGAGDVAVGAVLREHMAEAQGTTSSDRRSSPIDITPLRDAIGQNSSRSM